MTQAVEQKSWLAMDQYGNKVVLANTNHPRKALLKRHGVKSCSKQYETVDCATVHTGWVVSGHWYTVYEITPMENQA